MIISRTPFRVSLFGGGSDYPQWYRKHGGCVVGMAINKYCYISLRELPPFFDHHHRIVYSKVETVKDIDNIEHPAVRAVLNETGVDGGLEIHHDGDLPAHSGLGSSSSFTVGLLNAIYALKSETLSRHSLALEAIRIEQNVIKEHVGSQDQVWAAYGGLNRINFDLDGSIEVEPLILKEGRREELLASLCLIFSGSTRLAPVVAKNKIENLDRCHDQIKEMRDMVDEAVSIFQDKNIPIGEIGKMLHHFWCLKRELAVGISTPEIDAIYDAARSAGAIGGKLLGAGGGGFMVFFVPPEKKIALKEQFKNLVYVDFDIDTEGSKIVIHSPNGLAGD